MTDEKHITPEAHSDLVGGSTAARRIGCPRSYALEQLVPKVEGSSVYAQEGTALHELMAMTLGDGVEPTDMLPYTFTAKPSHGGWSHTISKQVWDDKGEIALEAFDRYVAQQEMRLDDDMTLAIENSVQFPKIPGAFGTADIIGHCGDEIFVLDWKFGSGIVPAKENKQLMFYAAGALNTMPDFFGKLDVTEDTKVTLVIIQPARTGVIDAWTTTVGRLDQYVEELLQAVTEAQELGLEARCEAGPWCKFARCQMVCDEKFDPVAKLAKAFEKLEQDKAEKASAPAIDWAKRWADLMELAEQVEPMIKTIRGEVQAALEAGQKVEGWALVPKRAGARTYAVDEDVVVNYMRSLNYQDDDWMPRKLPTLPQLEKILKHDELVMPPEFIAAGVSTGTKMARSGENDIEVRSMDERLAELAERLKAVR